MSPVPVESTEDIQSSSYFGKVRHKIKKNNEHISEGSSYLVSIGLLFPLIPMALFGLFYYFLFFCPGLVRMSSI